MLWSFYWFPAFLWISEKEEILRTGKISHFLLTQQRVFQQAVVVFEADSWLLNSPRGLSR